MNRLLYVVLIAVTSMLSGLAQDPLKVAPENYKLVFENEWVKVTQVHYGAKAKLPAHAHTETAAAYVYLNDCGPVVFKHINASYGAIKRPAVKAGSFRLYKGISEVHEVENPNETPSDFLRVEFLTEPMNENSLKGKYFRESYPENENFSKVQFENEQIRITRLVIAPKKKLAVATGAMEPALLIALSPAKLKVSWGKRSLTLDPGKTEWLSVQKQETLENSGEGQAEFLRFDFKTKPVPLGQKKDAPHPHK